MNADQMPLGRPLGMLLAMPAGMLLGTFPLGMALGIQFGFHKQAFCESCSRLFPGMPLGMSLGMRPAMHLGSK